MSDLLTIIQGDAAEKLRELPNESVQCCVCSPPYWGLRDYGCNGQLGLEKTPEEYVAKLAGIFREVRRVLRKDGTLWLNLGDSYAQSNGRKDAEEGREGEFVRRGEDRGYAKGSNFANYGGRIGEARSTAVGGLKPKDLCGIPWRVAFALQADGWWLRSDIIWAKPNPMPESVTDRPTKSHEYLFLLTKASSYFYDATAIAEPSSLSMLNQMNDGYNGEGLKDYEGNGVQNPSSVKSRIISNARRKHRLPAGWDTSKGGHGTIHREGRAPTVEYSDVNVVTRNKRSVWTVATAPYPEAHFATYPPDLIKPCILAGSCVGDMILDPFAGSGTTGMVALELGRKAILIDLKYQDLQRERCDVTPGLALA